MKQNSWTVTAISESGDEQTFQTPTSDWYNATTAAMNWAKQNDLTITKIEQAGVTVGTTTDQ